jgi:FkbM family methyltransferase|tara:strand:+ start:314 stop:997 length:684 start_codon:yes stop_codon:yes gene_type:complete
MLNYLLKVKLLISLLKHRGLFLKKQYSRNKEDQYLKKIFKNKMNGTYVDIGAFHPYRFSNTYLLYKKGWRGTNVDLNKESIDLFNIARPDDINLNVAIGSKNKKQIFYYIKKTHQMNTLNREFAKRYFYKDKTNIKKSTVTTKTFEFLIKNEKKIDLLDIDVEGSEYDVVKKINFKKVSFKIILIECASFNKLARKNTSKIKNVLLRANYKYIKNFGETCVYKNKSY